MNRNSTDLDKILLIVASEIPGIQVNQLQVSHQSDDDGLWYFSVPNIHCTVQIESTTRMCPFIVETDEQNSGSALKAATVDEAARLLIQYFEGKRVHNHVYLTGEKMWDLEK